jgi:diaminohydroxyphosphoribosylaminopyrimidine deaminase / 5-amino-6-(5-phosphoribosylamino)uracil reductase
MNSLDETWMKKCLQLAYKGRGNVSPNPMVGSVIVKDGKIVGEGFHQKYGQHHAEINAINDALKNVPSLHGSTLYVNLEPCYHFGNTPPCVNAILASGITRVVIACKDPNPQVKGKSILKLRQNGIECTIGILEKEAQKLNEKFLKFITVNKPFVALKAAQTLDGFIAKPDGTSRWITNAQSRKFVHSLRNEYDAVLVGANTVLIDNPELTVRYVKGRNPIRIIVDGRLIVPLKSKVFYPEAATVVYTGKSNDVKKLRKITSLEKMGIVVNQLKSKNDKIKMSYLVEDLGRHKISSVLVEGGQQTYLSFLFEHLVDKIYLFTSHRKFQEGVKTFGNVSIDLRSKLHSVRHFGTDELRELHLR